LAVFVGWPIGEFPRVRADIERSFLEAVGLAPELAERLRDGRRAGRFYGTADLPNFFCRPHGPGLALGGDAGHPKDPFIALGRADALRDAESLAEAIDEWRSGKRSEDEALADHERQRNEAAMPTYRENLQRARFEPLPAEALQLRAALRESQEDTDRF